MPRVMVIDGANGVEAQTLKLLEVCRSRKTPIVTFINKLDREVREPLDLLDEIEQHLGVAAVPVYVADRHWARNSVASTIFSAIRFACSAPGRDKAGGDVETLQALSSEEGERRFGQSWVKAKEEIDLDHRRHARFRPRAASCRSSSRRCCSAPRSTTSA